MSIPRRGLNLSLPYVGDLGILVYIAVGKRRGPAAKWTYLNVMPYCATCSYPDFQTSVTSQALVACRRHVKKAETGLPPTTDTRISSKSAMSWNKINAGHIDGRLADIKNLGTGTALEGTMEKGRAQIVERGR